MREAMEFTRAFYVNFGYPDDHFTLNILGVYIECGVRTFVFDLPSSDPFLEKETVKRNMSHVLARQGISGVMDGIAKFKAANADAEICLIVYSDSISSIGRDGFMKWCKANDIRHVGLISRERDESLLESLTDNGIAPNISAEYSLADALARGLGGDELITIQFGKADTPFRASFGERLKAVRAAAQGNPIFAEMGVLTKHDVNEVRALGADGVIIGGAAMDLWGKENELRDYLKSIMR